MNIKFCNTFVKCITTLKFCNKIFQLDNYQDLQVAIVDSNNYQNHRTEDWLYYKILLKSVCFHLDTLVLLKKEH